jgi:exonuclease III
LNCNYQSNVLPFSRNELKIVTWNVAGYRSIEKKGFAEYVKREQPDILCIQETKLQAGAIKNTVVEVRKKTGF